MDPTANLMEQADLIGRKRTRAESARLLELARAYSEWVANGGFCASHEARQTYDRALREAQAA